MRSFFLLLITLSEFYSGTAQVDLINKTVALRDSNVILEGIVNVFEIKNQGTASYQVTAKLSKVEKGSSVNEYNVRTELSGDDTFYVMQNKKIVLKKVFRVIPLPAMQAQWGVIKDSVATVAEIIANNRMFALIPGCRCFSRHAIASFRINFISNIIGNADRKISVTGNALDQKAIGIIKQLKAKDEIIFEDIITIDVDSSPKQLRPFSITIK